MAKLDGDGLSGGRYPIEGEGHFDHLHRRVGRIHIGKDRLGSGSGEGLVAVGLDGVTSAHGSAAYPLSASREGCLVGSFEGVAVGAVQVDDGEHGTVPEDPATSRGLAEYPMFGNGACATAVR